MTSGSSSKAASRILKNDDYQIDAVQDGLEACKKIDESHYDIVILDIMMPKIDGLEVLRRIKEGNPDIDVIMITGLSQIDTAVKSMKLGAFDYLPKPFEPDELKLVVRARWSGGGCCGKISICAPRSARNTVSRTSSAPARRCRASSGWSPNARPPIPR